MSEKVDITEAFKELNDSIIDSIFFNYVEKEIMITADGRAYFIKVSGVEVDG